MGAVALSGAAFLFSKLNLREYEDEIRRHNLALEQSQKSRELWDENQH